jgi:RNA polymerase sigma-70 factor (ECF subfamily)
MVQGSQNSTGLPSDLAGKKRAGFERFQTTPWTKLAKIKGGVGEESSEALSHLFRLYWKPIYSFLRHHFRLGHEKAKDVTQEFFAWALEKGFFLKPDRESGSFRSLLKVALRNFAHNVFRSEHRAKRGGSKIHISIEASGEDSWEPPQEGVSPEEVLDHRWKEMILNRAVEQLQKVYKKEGKEKQFVIIEEFYFGHRSYTDVCQRHEVPRKTVEHYLAGAKRRLTDLIGEQIAETVSGTDELRSELKELFG